MDLRQLRRMADLTQFDLARRSGVSRMRLSLAECGQVKLQTKEELSVRKVLLEQIESRADRLNQVLTGCAV